MLVVRFSTCRTLEFRSAKRMCISTGALVAVPSGFVRAGSLLPGDHVVAASTRGFAVVKEVKRTLTNPTTQMALMRGGLLISPWHPMRVRGQWVFPHNSESALVSQGYANGYGVTEVVSIELEGPLGTYGIIADGTAIATLNHCVTDHEVLSNPKWGSGWSYGAVDEDA